MHLLLEQQAKLRMYLIDTHAHLYAQDFDDDREEMLERARVAGVESIFLPNVDSQSIDRMLDLEAKYPDLCYPMMGLHPCSVHADYLEELKIVREWLERRKFWAVGEIGVDLYWDKTYQREQEHAFMLQTEWAIAFDLPIVIYSRASTELILNLLEPIKEEKLRGIFHCFSGTLEEAVRAIELGFLLGIGGVLTFKNAGLDELLKNIDLNFLVLETDAPYLAPVPFRGKRNESAYIAHVAERMASVKGVDIVEVARITRSNARRLFNLI